MTPSAPASLRALLAGSVDYAGLFPPAGLTLGPALENHADYVRGGDAWMLGRFVLPSTRLTEIGPLLAGRFDSVYPLRISALGSKAPSADGFLENLRTNLGEVVNFRQAHGNESAVDQLEAALPPGPAPVLPTLLRQAAECIETVLPGPSLRVFWEVPLSDDLPATLDTMAKHHAQFRRSFAVKFRTGGTEAAAFPTPVQLAGALLGARDAGVAVKFTAGLHHPVRRFDEALGTRMHGFLNVFAAGVLAREHRLDAAETQAILEDERPESFRFDAGGFAWRDRHVPTAALAAHREFVTSFGSCSFDEPRADLRGLGLIL